HLVKNELRRHVPVVDVEAFVEPLRQGGEIGAQEIGIWRGGISQRRAVAVGSGGFAGGGTGGEEGQCGGQEEKEPGSHGFHQSDNSGKPRIVFEILAGMRSKCGPCEPRSIRAASTRSTMAIST